MTLVQFAWTMAALCFLGAFYYHRKGRQMRVKEARERERAAADEANAHALVMNYAGGGVAPFTLPGKEERLRRGQAIDRVFNPAKTAVPAHGVPGQSRANLTDTGNDAM